MKISVIIASYNYAQYIEKAIISIIFQSYQNWELIIVDDGSNDNSVEIIKSYCEKDPRIKLFQHEDGINKGLKETLLLGIVHATGEWIAFLESDDFLEPENLLKKIEIIKKCDNVKLVFNKVKFLSQEKRKQQKRYECTQKKLSQMKFPRNMFYDFNVNNMILTFSCVMIDKSVLKNPDFETPIDAFLDWWLWVHIDYKNDFDYIDEELTNWRLHKKSYITEGKKPFFCFPQIIAYRNVYKQKAKSLKLLLFICYSQIITLFFFKPLKFLRRIF